MAHRTSFRAPDDAFVLVDLPAETAGAPARKLWVARYPATVKEFGQFIRAGGYEDRRWWSGRGWSWRSQFAITQPTYWGQSPYRRPGLPVTGVSFWEAEAYAHFRDAALPTEHEWYLFSSNGGGSRFPWGDHGDQPSDKHANLRFVSEFGTPIRVAVDVTVNSSSAAGVRDLIGNVAEWCLPHHRPELRSDEFTGVLRGGASWHAPGAADVSFRDEVPLCVRDNQTGIRLVRRPHALVSTEERPPIGWPAALRPLGRAMKRPTKPFRQEDIPNDLNEKTWRLRVHGDVPAPGEFSLKDLRVNFPTTAREALFVCVCRWGELNRVAGVLLAHVLERCGLSLYDLDKRLLFLRQVSVPGPTGLVYETTVPLADAINHGALLVYMMDDSDLTPELGWPLRYIDFHQYGYKNVKCLSELIVTDTRRRGWWEEKCQYDIDGTILPGTVTIVGPEAMRVDIVKRGKVDVPASWKVRPK